ncbi:unnamed protein product [Candidula unifasciata]|uniref:Lengsin n=1 Tax=Candidula unifasciata TaxID=100452 RepID=A0A8S3ZL28_9EUPU|nr:unnamed protein product [Candidula unifasciata]
MRLTTENHRNAFGESSADDGLLPVAQHWIAGLIHHGSAVTALARPTLNCYPDSDNSSDLLNSWTTDSMDRTHRLQVHKSNTGVILTDRLPTLASNPYIVLGALIAAGLDGILNKLELNDQATVILRIPPTFCHALASLEEDKVFENLIGQKFVHRFALLKKEYELARLEKWRVETIGQDLLDFERSLYLTSL